jgi:transposase
MAKKAVIGAVTYKPTHQIYDVIRTGEPFDANFLGSRIAIQDGISYSSCMLVASIK